MAKIEKIIIVTGSSGDIGANLIMALMQENFSVIGIDKVASELRHPKYTEVLIDLNKYVYEKSYQLQMNKNLIKLICGNEKLFAVINVAAIQNNKSLIDCEVEDWQQSCSVNFIAPFLFGKFFYKQLAENSGYIINITSIHECLTKKMFGLYSVTKTALAALNRIMSIEWGEKIKVVSISPAAIKTKMLFKGFNDDLEKAKDLGFLHPSGSIGEPRDISKLILAILKMDFQFINGTDITVDGGIRYKLCDLE
jgi:NAD(P)-dependent dehydrogenase (short-subunit alcohol dehydrogenase family)